MLDGMMEIERDAVLVRKGGAWEGDLKPIKGEIGSVIYILAPQPRPVESDRAAEGKEGQENGTNKLPEQAAAAGTGSGSRHKINSNSTVVSSVQRSGIKPWLGP